MSTQSVCRIDRVHIFLLLSSKSPTGEQVSFLSKLLVPHLLQHMWRQQGLDGKFPPAVTALLLEKFRNVGHRVSVEVRFMVSRLCAKLLVRLCRAGSLVNKSLSVLFMIEDWDGDPPAALSGDAPVGPSVQHGQ